MQKQNKFPKKLSLQKRTIVNLSRFGTARIGGGNDNSFVLCTIGSELVCFQSEIVQCTTGPSPGCFTKENPSIDCPEICLFIDKESKYRCQG